MSSTVLNIIYKIEVLLKKIFSYMRWNVEYHTIHNWYDWMNYFNQINLAKREIIHGRVHYNFEDNDRLRNFFKGMCMYYILSKHKCILVKKKFQIYAIIISIHHVLLI